MYAVSAINGVIALLVVFLDTMYATVLTLITAVVTYISVWRLGYIEEMRMARGEGPPPIQPLSVARIIDISVLIVMDLVAIAGAFVVTYWVRFHSGLTVDAGFVPFEIYIASPGMLILVVSWIAVLALSGLYEVPWDVSRIDYSIGIVKASAAGTLLLFLATLDMQAPTVEGRLSTFIFGASVAVFVILGRMVVVSIERRHEILGFRRRKTLIVGASGAAPDLLRDFRRRPDLRYDVIGFVDTNPPSQEYMGYPVLGGLDDIPRIVRQYTVEEVLVAAPIASREGILDIVARCNGMVPSVKIVPETVDSLSGFKFEEVIGPPLIRLHPTNMRRWQWIVKRLVDVVVSIVVLVPLLPVWLVIGVLIRLDSPGPALFRQERVGKKGRVFWLYKFRSMIPEAERETGPVWATPDDKRVTRLGRVLRKLRLDEVPQFINVLKGEMSLVGPRPERPYFVEQLKGEIGFYTRRLFVRPGITGWAQVRHRYDQSLEDVREKIRYDLYYLENMSLTLDLKIILRTVFVALSGRGTH
jgi:exopolysaccharide biosynthesis polyprenyl glycosylphosphotransferase